jgi:intraflagellar transport protein 172
MAFVIWNRYLDLSDAIEDGNPMSSVDNSDFLSSDIPIDAPLPKDNLPVHLFLLFHEDVSTFIVRNML